MQKYVVILIIFLMPSFINAAEVINVPSKHKNGWIIYDPPSVNLHFPQKGPCVAKDGSIWFGSGSRYWWSFAKNGALRYSPSAPTNKRWTFFDQKDGLPDGPITSIVQDHKGVFWFAGGASGQATLTRYDPLAPPEKTWHTYTNLNALPDAYVGWSLMVDRKNHIWMTTYHTDNLTEAHVDSSTGGYGIVRFDGKTWTTFTVEDGLVHNRVYDITEDHNGHIWIGTLKGISRFNGHQWTTFKAPNGPKVKKVYRIVAMQDSSLWFTHGNADNPNGGTGLGGVTIFKNGEWQHITPNEDLPIPYVRFIHQASDKSIWLGTHAHDNVTGLIRYQNSTWAHIKSYDTLPRNNVYGITSDHQGHIWTLPSGSLIARYNPNQQ